MSYHSIIFTCKDSVDIPEEHIKSLNDFVNELYPDITLLIDKMTITLCCRYAYWLYVEDIDYIIQGNKLTLGMIEAYKWLKENTHVKSECWNPCDSKYGPDSWEDIEKELAYLKNTITTDIKQPHA